VGHKKITKEFRLVGRWLKTVPPNIKIPSNTLINRKSPRGFFWTFWSLLFKVAQKSKCVVFHKPPKCDSSALTSQLDSGLTD